MKNRTKIVIQIVIEVFLIPYILLKAIKSRYSTKKIDIGIGPQPLINNIYHKKALELYGYRVETFVSNTFYITNKFDIVLSNIYNIKSLFGIFRAFIALINLSFKYKVLYFYFNGGPLGLATQLLWRIEPFIYRLGNVKTVVMPYGSDIQDMFYSKNLYFKHTLAQDYPLHKKRRGLISKKVNLWTRCADHVISGCEWVDYMQAWDTLMIAHFSIDDKKFKYEDNKNDNKKFKIFHAPNHQAIKGTKHLINAVEELQKDGYEIELIMLTKVSNEKIIETIKEVDIVADQFVIGWYAMFALEAMIMGKPVMCYLRDDLIELYTKAGLIKKDEIPIINTDVLNIKEKIIWAYENKKILSDLGIKSREYAQRHHSLEYVGQIFDTINKKVFGN